MVTEVKTPQRRTLKCKMCGWGWTQKRTSKNLPEKCPNPECRSKRWKKGKA